MLWRCMSPTNGQQRLIAQQSVVLKCSVVTLRLYICNLVLGFESTRPSLYVAIPLLRPLESEHVIAELLQLVLIKVLINKLSREERQRWTIINWSDVVNQKFTCHLTFGWWNFRKIWNLSIEAIMFANSLSQSNGNNMVSAVHVAYTLSRLNFFPGDAYCWKLNIDLYQTFVGSW